MSTIDTDRQLYHKAQDIHLALGAAIEYDDTSMLAAAVATSHDFWHHTLPDLDALRYPMLEIGRALKEGTTPDRDLLEKARETASIVVSVTDPDTPDVATGPFSVYITETIVHRVTITQDYLNGLDHITRQDDPSDLHAGSMLGVAILDDFAAEVFGSQDETFESCDDREIQYDYYRS